MYCKRLSWSGISPVFLVAFFTYRDWIQSVIFTASHAFAGIMSVRPFLAAPDVVAGAVDLVFRQDRLVAEFAVFHVYAPGYPL